jgi:hypothetical protein
MVLLYYSMNENREKVLDDHVHDDTSGQNAELIENQPEER